MSDLNPMGAKEEAEPGRQFRFALLAGLLVVVVLGGAAYFLLRGSGATGSGTPVPLPMGDAELAYAPQIKIGNVEMSRAANFLKQEVTSIGGTITNNGERSIAEMEVTLEFHDVSQKVVLREARRVYGPKETPLAPHETREFLFAFESVPPDWNQAPPVFVITGLKLQ
ncbi:MAG TPA: FxLYD domain-containing protein [Candidatus Acidoferrum sp.]|nr:FxLYD domain-containing protein [Candidatus Acidoferrum sp.]